MKRFLMLFTVLISLSLVFAFAGIDLPEKKAPVRQAFMEKAPGSFDAVEYVNAQRAIFDWLNAEAAPISMETSITIHVSREEMDEVNNHQCQTCSQWAQAVRIGLTKPVGVNAAFRNLKSLTPTADGGFVWTFSAESPGATALRVHLSNFNLPENAVLYIYGINGEAFGPYSNLGPGNAGDFWTHTVTGPIAYLQLRHFGPVSESDLRSISFNIADIGHIGPKFLIAFFHDLDRRPEEVDKALEHCSYNEPCVEDASCYSGGVIEDAKSAVAHMQWISGAFIYYCTGGLIADTDTGSQIPYFLTANHCISKDRDARNLECFWQYKTSNCNASCPDPGTFPRTMGADILHTSRDGDHTLMQLRENPPSGSVFMGWLNQYPADGTRMFRISHPSGAPQAYSEHIVDSDYVVCSGLPLGEFIYSQDVDGATEGGSSGAPVYNMNGQILGQLYGACGYTLEVCDAEENRTVDGAFAFYYDDVKQWLDTTPPENYPPTADFSYSTSGLTVDFTDQSTDSDGTVVAWSWDFGDGNTSTQQNPTHTYASANTYTVTLTVTDDDSATDSVSKSVTVSETQGGELHVQSINLSLKTAGPNNTCKAEVTIVDEYGSPVAGATVTGDFSGDVTGTDSGITDASGKVTLSIKIKSPVTTFTFCVTDVSLSGWTYVPGLICDTY
jgi:PKD repeat protein